MELLRILALILLSSPMLDDALPAATLASVRATLLRPGDAPNTVERSLGIQRYTWHHGGFDPEFRVNTYLAPDSSHFITIWYKARKADGKLELRGVEVKRMKP